MNAGTGKVEINRDYYEYMERFEQELRNGMRPLDEAQTAELLREFWMVRTQVLAGVAVIV